VHEADVIAVRVFPIVSELDGGAAIVGFVRPGEGAFRRSAWSQPDVPQRFHRGEIQVGMAERSHRTLARVYDFKLSSRCLTMASLSMPSPSALKFAIIRWRRTGTAMRLRSLTSGVGRPSSSALALAAVTRCCVARGPAPHAT